MKNINPKVRASEPLEFPTGSLPPHRVRFDSGEDVDSLQSFEPERSVQRFRLTRNAAVSAAVLIVLCVSGSTAWYFRNRGSTASTAVAARSGHVSLHSRPEGAAVSVDGVAKGVTPLEAELPAGSHEVLFSNGTTERRLAITVEAAVRSSENIDLPPAQSKTGLLEVTSDPRGARVTLDGRPAGVTPLKIANVSAARHVVIVTQGDAVVSRSVDVSSGATSNVFVALAHNPGTAGWFVLQAPLELRILENGVLLGLSGGAPLMLSPGRHQLELVNDSVEMHLTKTLTIDSGKSTRLSVPLPTGTLSVNASPWAEVAVDGTSIGTTPLGSITLVVGRHELVARHPKLGEQRRTITVGALTPLRVSLDFNR